MSAFGVGADTATVKDGQRTNTADSSTAATIVKWIPGEAVTFYAAILGVGVTQGEVTGNETPQELLERIDAGSPGWFLLAAAIGGALVIMGAVSAKPSDRSVHKGSVTLRVLLALLAFTLWTTALPGAWPYGWTLIRDMGAAYALLLVPLAAIFAGLAEWATRRYSL